MGLSEGLTFITYFVTFWYGGKLISDGEYTFLDVMKVLMAIIMSAMAVGQTSALMPNLKKAKVAASHVFKIIDEVSPIDSLSMEGTKEDIRGKIELKAAEFSYPTRKDVHVLRGLNLVLEPGKVTALVGQSGCGKVKFR